MPKKRHPKSSKIDKPPTMSAKQLSLGEQNVQTLRSTVSLSPKMTSLPELLQKKEDLEKQLEEKSANIVNLKKRLEELKKPSPQQTIYTALENKKNELEEKLLEVTRQNKTVDDFVKQAESLQKKNELLEKSNASLKVKLFQFRIEVSELQSKMPFEPEKYSFIKLQEEQVLLLNQLKSSKQKLECLKIEHDEFRRIENERQQKNAERQKSISCSNETLSTPTPIQITDPSREPPQNPVLTEELLLNIDPLFFTGPIPGPFCPERCTSRFFSTPSP